MPKIVFGIGEVFKNVCMINLPVLVQQNINNKKLWGLFSCVFFNQVHMEEFLKKKNVNNCMWK